MHLYNGRSRILFSDGKSRYIILSLLEVDKHNLFAIVRDGVSKPCILRDVYVSIDVCERKVLWNSMGNIT